jgi:hypothetical protein
MIVLKGELLLLDIKIDYKIEYPPLNPFEMNAEEVATKMLTIKSNDWEYEDEIRFIAFGYSNRTLNLPDGIIDQVIIGCNTSDDDKKEIIKYAKDKNLKVLRSKIREDAFGSYFETLVL